MASCRSTYSDPTNTTGGGGVCMMSSKWRDEQNPLFINFISSFLNANSFRLNFVLIAPDFIFNCGGLSVSFVFVTNWVCNSTASAATLFNRVKKLKEQFAHLYVVVTLPTKDHNESFVRSYFKYGMQLGRPAFVPVQDIEMGFEKMVKIAHSRGVCKRCNALSKMKAEIVEMFAILFVNFVPRVCLFLHEKRKQLVQGMEIFLKVVTSIPLIDNHDANALNQAIGSIQAIARASKEYILENTDLSAEKAEMVFKFFRDPKLFLGPKIN